MKKWPYLLALVFPLFSCATKPPANQPGHVKLVFEVQVGRDGRPAGMTLISAEGNEANVEAGVLAAEADIKTWNFGPERAGSTLRLPFLYSPKKPTTTEQVPVQR